MTDNKKHFLNPKYKILFYLNKLGGRATYRELIETTKLANATFYMNVKELMLEGLVVKEGKYYKLTEAGEQTTQKVIKELLEVVEA